MKAIDLYEHQSQRDHEGVVEDEYIPYPNERTTRDAVYGAIITFGLLIWIAPFQVAAAAAILHFLLSRPERLY